MADVVSLAACMEISYRFGTPEGATRTCTSGSAAPMRMPPIPTDRGRSCWSSLARALPYGLRHGGGSGPCGCRWIGTATVDWEGSATGRGKPVLILGRAARARSRSSVQPSVRAGKPTLPVAAACLTAGQERAACVQARDTAGEGGGGWPRASQREVYKGRGAHCTRALASCMISAGPSRSAPGRGAPPGARAARHRDACIGHHVHGAPVASGTGARISSGPFSITTT